MYGTYPLFFELAIETTFPIPEACVSGVLVCAQSVIQAVFLAIPTDSIGTDWMNYTIIGTTAFFFLVLMVFKESYNRLQVDMGKDTAAGILTNSWAEDEYDKRQYKILQ